MKPNNKHRVKLTLTKDKLKRFRVKMGLTQKEMASHLLTSESSIAMKERGEREITITDELLFCEAVKLLKEKTA